METKNVNEMKTVVDSPDVTVQTTELQEKVDNSIELKLKKDQLKSKLARLNGGVCPIMKREMMPIDKEIDRAKAIARLKELEMQYDAPIRPKFAFEQNDEWRSLARKFKKEEVDNVKEALGKLEEQKKTIHREIKELEKRIEQLESGELDDEETGGDEDGQEGQVDTDISETE